MVKICKDIIYCHVHSLVSVVHGTAACMITNTSCVLLGSWKSPIDARFKPEYVVLGHPRCFALPFVSYILLCQFSISSRDEGAPLVSVQWVIHREALFIIAAYS